MYDLISIGDCVIDTFIPLQDAKLSMVDGEALMSLRYGDKIPVGPSLSLVAGNAANNAVGSSRLKLKTAIYTNVGNAGDERDDLRIINKLKKEKVDTRYVIEHDDLPSNHHIVLNYKGERTILIYHQPWKFNLPDLEKSKWVYLTSMSPSYAQSPVIDQLVNFLQRTGTKLAYQPGTFQLKEGLKKNAKLLSLAELFIVNVEEAKRFLGHKEGDAIPIKKLLKGLLDLGPRLVIITDGGEGSYGYDGEKFYKIGIFPADLVEMTGAGDSYATAAVAALIHGHDLMEAMRWGAANGAAVVEQIGPQAGLLTYTHMQEKLKEHKSIIAKEI